MTSVRRLLAIWGVTLALGCAPPTGHLQVTVIEPTTGNPTPARVELLDAEGMAHVPTSALRLTLQCVTAPPSDWAQWLVDSDAIDNPHSGTRQFYVDAPFEIELPAGRYTLRAFKGIERRVASAAVEIEPGGSTSLELAPPRWSDMPERGWYGADDHIHITRLSEADDVRISHWMQAEDLHVSNLLQMGTQAQIGVTPQHDFGDAGTYREGDHLLLAGQEHPRTHFLGHTITLGADSLVDLRDDYIVYERTFRAGRREGGVVGFAHFGRGPAKDGLATHAPRDLVDFMEVLQFEWPHYDVWYEALDLGIAITPTAGTDFPCGPWSLPGRERFYTRVEGRLDRASWLDGIRSGRTFVTNGPLLELRVNDAEIGDVIALPGPGRVVVEARVRFDPERDAPRTIELIRNGAPVAAPTREIAPGEIHLAAMAEVDEPSWFALRVLGDKLGEAPPEPLGVPEWVLRIAARIASGADIDDRDAWLAARSQRPSAAHTAPIWVTIRGSRPGDPAGARRWIERLDALESRLDEDRIADQTIWDGVPYSDGVSEEHLRRHREALLAAIAEARTRWAERGGLTPRHASTDGLR
jgi:hypothetical protein